MIRDCYYIPPLSQLRFLRTNQLSTSGIVVLCSDRKFINFSHKKLTLKMRSRFFSKNRIKIDWNLKKQYHEHTRYDNETTHNTNSQQVTMSTVVTLDDNKLLLLLLLFDPGTQFPGKKNYVLQRQNMKTSWNGLYSSFTKLSRSRIALKRWMRTESRWNKKLVSLSSPDWVESLRPSLDKNAHPDALLLLLLLLFRMIQVLMYRSHAT